MELTILFKSKMAEKLNIGKESDILNYLERAFSKGIKFKDIKHKSNKFYRYLADLSTRGNEDLLVYDRYIIVYSESADLAITIFDTPKEYYKLSEKIRKEKQND